MARPIAITALRVSPPEDQRRRFVMYTVTMSIRLICVLGVLFVSGWWQLVLLLGAVILPYIAVVLANVASTRVPEAPEAPGPREIPRSWPEP